MESIAYIQGTRKQGFIVWVRIDGSEHYIGMYSEWATARMAEKVAQATLDAVAKSTPGDPDLIG